MNLWLKNGWKKKSNSPKSAGIAAGNAPPWRPRVLGECSEVDEWALIWSQ